MESSFTRRSLRGEEEMNKHMHNWVKDFGDYKICDRCGLQKKFNKRFNRLVDKMAKEVKEKKK